MKPPANEFTITVAPLPDSSDVSGHRRLRAVLKVMRRKFGLRCTSVQLAQPFDPDSAGNCEPAFIAFELARADAPPSERPYRGD
jgi:hypothetical protein